MKISGSKIKEARKLKGLTQEDLAALSKMNLRTIQRIENNENTPRGKSLQLICEVLNIPQEELFEAQSSSRKTALVQTFINALFLIVLNFAIISVFGYLTIDSNSTNNSKIGALLLSFFISIFIVVKTPHFNKIERLLKFGIGLLVYTLLIFSKISFPALVMTGLFPSLIIVFATLFYGEGLLKSH